jgi:NAD+ kinase
VSFFIIAETPMSATPEPQQTIALVVRHNTAGIDQPVQAIVDFLRAGGYRVVLEQETAGHVHVAGVAAMTPTRSASRPPS